MSDKSYCPHCGKPVHELAEIDVNRDWWLKTVPDNLRQQLMVRAGQSNVTVNELILSALWTKVRQQKEMDDPSV
jgi:hypothetical protein